MRQFANDSDVSFVAQCSLYVLLTTVVDFGDNIGRGFDSINIKSLLN